MHRFLKLPKRIAFYILLLLFEATKRTHFFKLRIQDHRFRTLRASLLKRAIRSLQGTMVQCNFPGKILVESHGEASLSIVLNCQPGVLALTQKNRKSSTVSDSFLDFSKVFVSRFARASRSLSSTSRLVLPLIVLLFPPAGY